MPNGLISATIGVKIFTTLWQRGAFHYSVTSGMNSALSGRINPGEVRIVFVPLGRKSHGHADHACTYDIMIYEIFPTLLEFVKRNPNFYTNLPALILTNRLKKHC